MGKYLKKFDNHTQYEAFIGGGVEAVELYGEFIKPNVSYCEQENEVHYNPIPDPRLIIKYKTEDATRLTKLYYYYTEEGQEEYWITGAALFDKVEIDGTEVSIANLDAASGGYQLSAGEHTVKYTLKDPTAIAMGSFLGCGNITSVKIPDSVTTIGNYAFFQTRLTNISIPDNITSVGDMAFCECYIDEDVYDTLKDINDKSVCGYVTCMNVTYPDDATEAILETKDELECLNLFYFENGEQITDYEIRDFN